MPSEQQYTQLQSSGGSFSSLGWVQSMWKMRFHVAQHNKLPGWLLTSRKLLCCSKNPVHPASVFPGLSHLGFTCLSCNRMLGQMVHQLVILLVGWSVGLWCRQRLVGCLVRGWSVGQSIGWSESWRVMSQSVGWLVRYGACQCGAQSLLILSLTA
jgi:hypothetical protein